MTGPSARSTAWMSAVAPWLPWLSFAMGLLWLANLARYPEPPTQFVGDAAVKAYLLDGWLKGQPIGNQLHWPDVAPWVREIWQRFHFPFDAPFVFQGKLVFQALFLLLTLPGYTLLGYPGLLVLPALATVGIWVCIWRVLARAGLRPGPIALALAGLVLSPLTCFGMTFWEHTPGLFCLALALDLGWRDERDPAYGPRSSASFASASGCGLAIAAACGLRPELVLPSTVFVGWLLLRTRRRAALAIGASVGLAGIALVNTWTAGTPLGIQAPQVFYLERGPLLSGLIRFYRDVLVYFVVACPFATGTLVVGAVVAASEWKKPPPWTLLIAMSLVAVLLVPFMVPYSGDYLGFRRFELAALPLAALVGGFLAQRSRGFAMLVAALCVLQLVPVPRFDEQVELAYRGRVQPLYQAIVERQPAALISNSQYAFQELASLIGAIPMFWGSASTELIPLCEAVGEHVDLEDALLVWLRPADRDAFELALPSQRYRMVRIRLPGEGRRPAFALFRFERSGAAL